MHTLNIIVKNSPLPISIQRKEASDGERIYQQIMTAMNTASPAILELTCEKQEGKKVAIATSSIAAVIMSQDAGANASRAAGFFASVTE